VARAGWLKRHRLPAAISKRKEAGVTTISSFPHRVTRLVFDTGQPYHRFRGRYEAEVPPAGEYQAGRSGGRHARWLPPGAAAAGFGIHGFVLHWRADISPLMTADGERRPRTSYLMGSNAIGESIYRQHPALGLYAPLRTLIYVDTDDRTYFAVQQPSTLLAEFADPGLANLGLCLDRQLADLLDALGIRAAHCLRDADPEPAATVRRIPREAREISQRSDAQISADSYDQLAMLNTSSY
jgi:hypothetical protein